MPDSINHIRGNQYASANLSFGRDGSGTGGISLLSTTLNIGSSADTRTLILDNSVPVPFSNETIGATFYVNPKQTMIALGMASAIAASGGIGVLFFTGARMATAIGEVATTAIATKTLQYIH